MIKKTLFLAFVLLATTGSTTFVSVVYDWDFGDGSPHSADQNPTHVYTSPGLYAWTLRVTADGQTSERKGDIWITSNALPTIALSTRRLVFGSAGGKTTGPQSVRVGNVGGGTLHWTATPSAAWISVSPAGGTGAGIADIGVNPGGLASGNYTGTVSFFDPNATNSPQTVDLTLKVYEADGSAPPIGSFDTPQNNATVRSSIPVTGWALDDIGVEGVKIYRDPEPGEPSQPNGLVFIGNAFLIEGARGDIEQAFPTYPWNHRAGWGYMLLTNFLPNQGNGTFVISAIARDVEGHETTIGTKTILCDNAAAVKPFGAIDTPPQGGTATGNPYVNFGWALTPPPKFIPTDGSTIWVWVDGVRLGHPSYGHYREDIATLFPGYANSMTGVGLYNLDTTAYPNGVHSIAWSVSDSAGLTDGIGSRYFTVMNGASPAASLALPKTLFEQPPLSPRFDPVGVLKGYDRTAAPERVNPDPSGQVQIILRELERVEIRFAGRLGGGTEVIGESARPLPIGSSLDFREGVFAWLPGPGFLGEYNLEFVEGGGLRRVRIVILPRTSEPRRPR